MIAFSLMIALIAFLGLGAFVGIALYATGLVSIQIFGDVPVLPLLAFDFWKNLNAPELAALPLFILMGEILFNTRLSQNLFRGLSPLLSRLPGGLLHVNVLACTLFAAVSGSSAATTATIGRMTLDELDKRGLDRNLAMGSLCGAGTLGFLIPPSIIMILYGVLTETSIVNLFISGLVPGMMLAGLYMLYIMIRAGKTYTKAPPAPEDDISLITALMMIAPVIAMIALVLGSLYLGWASPTEAAIVGVSSALLFALYDKSLSVGNLQTALFGALKTTAMIGLILAGALFLSRVMAFLEVPQMIATAIAALDLAPFALIMLLLIFYIFLGMVLDGLSVIIMTLPIVFPMVLSAGYDPIWFGIFLVIVVEMAQITPPVGFNLFVVQGLTQEKPLTIAKASLPFFLIMAGFVMLITIFPAIATFLIR